MGGGDTRSYRLLVTGAAGFLGSHVVEHFLSKGHRVWALDAFDAPSRPERKRANAAEMGDNARLRWIEGDVRDEVLIDGLLGSVPFDAVVHLAAHSPVRAALRNTLDCFDTNLTGTLRLLEAMRRHHATRLVMGSTGEVYSQRSDGPATSDRPVSPYGASKRSAELACHAWHCLGGVSVHALRFFEVYGPRQPADSEVARMRQLILAGERVPSGRKGEPWGLRDYLYVADAARAVGASATRLVELGGGPGEFAAYDIGTGTGVAREEMVAAIGRSTGRRPRTRGASGRVLDFERRVADPRRASDELNFAATTDLDAGLAELEAWHDAAAAPLSRPALVR